MRELVSTLGPRVRDAFAALLPGPVTLVVHNPQRLYPLASRNDPERLGVRLIEGPLSGVPGAFLQTSANPSGASAPARSRTSTRGSSPGRTWRSTAASSAVRPRRWST